MNTNEFLSKLDYDQLVRAREICFDLIEKKKKETKIPLWIVSDDVNLGAFVKDQYKEACELLCKEIMKRHKLYGEGDIEYEIKLKYFRESEAKDMLKLND
jgi:abortive infection bacteriophage resistance protein